MREISVGEEYEENGYEIGLTCPIGKSVEHPAVPVQPNMERATCHSFGWVHIGFLVQCI